MEALFYSFFAVFGLDSLQECFLDRASVFMARLSESKNPERGRNWTFYVLLEAVMTRTVISVARNAPKQKPLCGGLGEMPSLLP